MIFVKICILKWNTVSKNSSLIKDIIEQEFYFEGNNVFEKRKI